MRKAIFIMPLLALQLLAKVPFYFTLELTTFDEQGRLKNAANLKEWLQQARELGASGVIADLWWATAEKAPGQYDFAGYLELARLVRDADLELQFTLSFHGCSEDDASCPFKLPGWVLAAKEDIWPRSASGRVSREYISPFADNERVLGDRTPLEAYAQFIDAFSAAFWEFLGTPITEVQVGLGPSGQLRFPSYRSSAFCGVGEFMSFDKSAKGKLAGAGLDLGKLSLTNDSTDDAWKAPFFRSLKPAKDSCTIMGALKLDCGTTGTTAEQCAEKGCCWAEVVGEPYCFMRKINEQKAVGDVENTAEGKLGQTYAETYSRELLAHADRVLALARERLFFIRLGAKLSAVHWSAGSANRAPEMTAGYLVNEHFNFYELLMPILAKHKVVLVVSGFEMPNNNSPQGCFSRARDLVHELKGIAARNHVEVMGENAWVLSDAYTLNNIADNSSNLSSFNFLRLSSYAKGNEYVKGLFALLLEKLSAANAATFYDLSIQRKTPMPEIDCDDCSHDPLKDFKKIL